MTMRVTVRGLNITDSHDNRELQGGDDCKCVQKRECGSVGA